MKRFHWITVLFLTFGFISLPLYGVEERGAWWDKSVRDAKEAGYFLLTLKDAKKVINKDTHWLIVDVRPAYEFESGHLPNAVNLEFHLGDRSNLTREKGNAFSNLLGKDKNRPILIYCRSYS